MALRELRGGLRGFYVFLACLALGVAAIAGVGSLARSLSEGLTSQGQAILGGDVALTLVHRRADAEERAFLARSGDVSEVATLRAMARLPDLSDQALVEIKAIDDAYPLYGAVTLEGGSDSASTLAKRDGVWGAAAEATLMQRLQLQPGSRVEVGDIAFEIRAVIAAEPDRLTSNLIFGPRLMIAAPALDETGLVRPGSLIQWRYRVRLPVGQRSDAALSRFVEEATAAAPTAGWRIRDRAHASPRLQTSIDRFTQVLTLVGLTALIVGGVGVANAVRGHLETKRQTIAVMKCLGAPAGAVFLIYLIEIGLIAIGGIVIGLAIGSALPLAGGPLIAMLLPLRLEEGLYLGPLLLAAGYGLLTALSFSLWPLGAARDVPPAALFRDLVAPERRWPRARYIVAVAVAAGALLLLAVATAAESRIAHIYLGVSAGAIVLLRLVALAVMALARRAPALGVAEVRLALGNIHRPGALTPSVVLSLGLGLALLVALALIDRNLVRELTAEIPDRAPSFFFVDVQRDEAPAFTRLLAATAPDSEIETVPMLRGRIVSLAGVPAEDIDPPPEARWVLNGDRGITYSDGLPEGSRLVAGQWWPPDYQGEPLVSFDAELAMSLNLALGDEIAVNVLGRQVTAKLASLRTVDWQSLGINFVMIFSPNTFAGAPHMILSSLTLPEEAGGVRDSEVMSAVSRAFPHVTIVRVKEALDTANALLGEIMWAIRGASGITIIASVLVLAGALAAGQRGRIRDAAILKTFGATRRRLMAAFALEYLLLALATAIFAILIGTAAAYLVLTQVMHASFVFAPTVAIGTTVGAALALIALGLAANWRVLGLKPAPILRTL
jgi:putative ABC transport system permease protein